ncbi:MAG: O-methyltransferase [Melioribacteraceae bacterium]|nr:O-methyltransferase [Melioribacteraceae bacterium]
MPQILSPNLRNYLRSSGNDDDHILREMETFAREHNIPILEKSSSIFLEQLLLIYQPKKFLEIGTAIGYSTIRVAKTLKKTAKIYTIELSKHNIELAIKYFKRSGCRDRIDIIEGDAIKILKDSSETYDFIFLDADKEDYLDYLELCINRLNIGGVFFVDNLLWKGYVVSDSVPDEHKKSTEFIKKFNAQFIKHPNLKSSIIPIGDGIGLGIKIR